MVDGHNFFFLQVLTFIFVVSHSQMNTRIFDAFNLREQQVTEYMAGCGMKYGMDCTCGPACLCKNCPIHSNGRADQFFDPHQVGNNLANLGIDLSSIGNDLVDMHNSHDGLGQSTFNEHHINEGPLSNFSSMGPPAPIGRHFVDPISMIPNRSRRPVPAPHNASIAQATHSPQNNDRVIRNPSILSYGNNVNRNSMRGSIRGMSITSETTFGRAMSGLSALSIDWENLEDFDVEVDHSAHITGSSPNTGNQGGTRRASVRRSVMSTGSGDQHVSFRV